MKKKIILLSVGCVLAVSTMAVSLAASQRGGLFKYTNVKGTDDFYSITFDAADFFDIDRETSGAEVIEYYESGSKVLKTDQLHNDVTFGFTNLYRYDFNDTKYFEVKANNEGALFNESAINSIDSLTVNGSGTFKFEWGWTKSAGVVVYEDREVYSLSGSDRTFYFGGYHPNYFKISNNEATARQLANFQIKLLKDCVLGESPFTVKDGIKYVKYGVDAYSVAGFAGESMATLNIPDTVNDLPVKRIGASAFKNDKTITSLTLPNQLAVIENDAFSGCSNIGAIEIPNTVVSIRDRAFNGTTGCTALTFEAGGTSTLDLSIAAFQSNGHTGELVLPKRIDAISYDGYVFSGCSGITNFALNSDDVAGNIVSIDDGVLFANMGNSNYYQKVLVSYPRGNARSTYTIPSDCTRICTRDGLSESQNITKLIINNDVDLFFGAGSATGMENLEDIEFAQNTHKVIFYWYAISSEKLNHFVVPTNVEVQASGFGSLEGTETTPRNIYFDGTASDWADANWSSNWDGRNNNQTHLKLLYRSDSEPANEVDKLTSWHYVDSVPTPWLKQMTIVTTGFNTAGNIYALWAWNASIAAKLYVGSVDGDNWTINIPGELDKIVLLRLNPDGGPYVNESTSWPTGYVWNQSQNQEGVTNLQFTVQGLDGGDYHNDIYGIWA